MVYVSIIILALPRQPSLDWCLRGDGNYEVFSPCIAIELLFSERELQISVV